MSRGLYSRACMRHAGSRLVDLSGMPNATGTRKLTGAMRSNDSTDRTGSSGTRRTASTNSRTTTANGRSTSV